MSENEPTGLSLDASITEILEVIKEPRSICHVVGNQEEAATVALAAQEQAKSLKYKMITVDASDLSGEKRSSLDILAEKIRVSLYIGKNEEEILAGNELSGLVDDIENDDENKDCVIVVFIENIEKLKGSNDFFLGFRSFIQSADTESQFSNLRFVFAGTIPPAEYTTYDSENSMISYDIGTTVSLPIQDGKESTPDTYPKNPNMKFYDDLIKKARKFIASFKAK